jgi:hypothetical protein
LICHKNDFDWKPDLDLEALATTQCGRAQGETAAKSVSNRRHDGETKTASLVSGASALETCREAPEDFRRNNRAVIYDPERAVGSERDGNLSASRAMAQRILDQVPEQNAERIGIEVGEHRGIWEAHRDPVRRDSARSVLCYEARRGTQVARRVNAQTSALGTGELHQPFRQSGQALERCFDLAGTGGGSGIAGFA